MNRNNVLYCVLMAGKERGGYVLVALIAFILGIALTYFCLHYGKRKDKDEKDTDL